MKNRFIIITLILVTLLMTSVSAATLNCQQITDSELSIPQFSSETVEITCTASGGTVSNIQITPNADPSSGLTISSTQTISSSLSDSASGTARWSVTGDTPNSYDVSYTVQSDGTNSWTGASTTDVTVPSGAQLAVTYNDAPNTYSSGDTLDIEIENIGGTTANNVKLKLNSDSVKSYPTTIAAGATASYSWTSSTGYDSADTYTTYVYIGSTQHDSIATVVSTSGGDDDDVVAPAGGGGGASGGAGGGAGAGTPISTGASKMMAWVAVVPGQILKFLPGSSDIPFSYIELTSKSDIASMTLTVKSMDEKPQFVEEVENKYKYMEVVFDGAAQENFEEGVTLTFRVTKAWVNENTDDKNNVFLSRHSNNVWNKLETLFDSEDDEYYYYSVTSPGFSYFAVSAEPKLAVETTDDDLEGIDDGTDDVPTEGDVEGDETDTGDTVVKKSSSIFWVVLGALFVMMIAWLVYHYGVKAHSQDASKDSKNEDSKEFKESKQSKEAKVAKESKDLKELKEPKAKPKKD
jgi:PGF-pre-PGF domain-containing protein